jgi:hypothetical protein
MERGGDEWAWHPGRVYEGWAVIHRALNDVMATLPKETLAFLSERAYDMIIRDAAADALNANVDAATVIELRRTFRKEADETEESDDDRQLSGLEQAVAFAKENDQVALWDRAGRLWSIAVYDEQAKRLHPLTDEEAATVLNRDAVIAREWRKWNAMTQNEGSLIVLDAERVRRVLNEVEDERGDDPMNAA